MLKSSAALCALAIVSIPVPAQGEGGTAWIKETTDKGCYLHEFGNAYPGMANDPNPSGFIWTGACSAGKPIDGKGTLYVQNKTPSGALVWSYTGEIDNGLPNGPIQVLQYTVNADGTWDPSAGVSDPNFAQILFNQGCPSYGECQPGNVQNPVALRQVNPPYFPLPKASAAKGKTQKDEPPSDGDVFDKCVKLVSLGRSGIQMLWELENTCNTNIKVSYCFRSKYSAVGDPNLCKRFEHRTDAILANGSLDFPFTLADDGTAMSDGRIARSDELIVVGYACANGSRPNVVFIDRQFLFRGC